MERGHTQRGDIRSLFEFCAFFLHASYLENGSPVLFAICIFLGGVGRGKGSRCLLIFALNVRHQQVPRDKEKIPTKIVLLLFPLKKIKKLSNQLLKHPQYNRTTSPKSLSLKALETSLIGEPPGPARITIEGQSG